VPVRKSHCELENNSSSHAKVPYIYNCQYDNTQHYLYTVEWVVRYFPRHSDIHSHRNSMQSQFRDWIGLCSVLRPLQHSIGYMGDGFTGQKTQPTVTKYWRKIYKGKQKQHKEHNTHRNTK